MRYNKRQTENTTLDSTLATRHALIILIHLKTLGNLQNGNNHVEMPKVTMSQNRLSNLRNPEYSSNCRHLISQYAIEEDCGDLLAIPEITILIASTDHK